MTIALYIDEHIPRAITAGLRLRGVDVLIQEDERAGTPDPILLDRATKLQQKNEVGTIRSGWKKPGKK